LLKCGGIYQGGARRSTWTTSLKWIPRTPVRYPRPVEGTARVTIGELDGWLRSMTTMGSVDDTVVRRVLESHRELLPEQRELKR
jgi:hypothetical protein